MILFNVRAFFYKLWGKYQLKKANDLIEYNPQNIERLLQKYSEQNQYINNLENSLKEAENKSTILEDIIFRYEKIVREEIALYRLHKSNFSVLSRTYNENELLIDEIQHQLHSFITTSSKSEEVTPFKRIFTRFFHQNELYKSRVSQKMVEIDETIEKKNRLLERMQSEMQNWNNSKPRLLSSQQVSVKQAFG